MYLTQLYQRFSEAGKVSTDTRQITPGSLFFALRGDKFNANEFAAQALEKGATYAVVDDARYAVNERYILVEDALTALQALAKHHRSRLKIPVVGLTGSNGKTTSKELVLAVLDKKFKTYATKGNLNNHIGVPLTILSIDHSYEMAVVEMGANHLGEIALLCSIANPTHGLITNIGKAHIGTFGGFENIIRGKSELYQHLLTTDGIVFINSQSPVLANMAKRFKHPYFYPAAGDYYQAQLLNADPFIRFKAEDGEEVQTQLMGAYNFENMAAALCIGKFFGVDAKEANRAVAEYVPGNMRSQVITKGSNTIILDAYNANPSSMEAAVENLAAMKAKKKVAIVGDMFELEEEAAKEHARMGELLKAKKFDSVYLCGSLMQSAKASFADAVYCEQKAELIELLKRNPIRNSTVLIKASRGMGLETIVDYL
ncbi:MAG: UDP-N-acetylmuramoyl-tripeptide--D-alanyl-D-alanine ligase [Cyclobacteriaceae bacterium]|nr:UDP-N-acetylmuramoyl-tripeptide--D-alanyl-D-alanine ligase [Cyclobacteriaceae bacterium]